MIDVLELLRQKTNQTLIADHFRDYPYLKATRGNYLNLLQIAENRL